MTAADSLGRWALPDDQPQMAGQRLFGDRRELSWLLDTTLPAQNARGLRRVLRRRSPAGARDQFFVRCGHGCFARCGHGAPRAAAPAAGPRPGVQSPRSSSRATAQRAAAVGSPHRLAAGRGQLPAGRALLRDGRQLAFRSLHLPKRPCRLCGRRGSRKRWDTIAEIHMPAADAWDAWFDTLAVLAPQGDGRLVWLQTPDGLRVTASTERFRPDRWPGDDDPAHWFHVVQLGLEPGPLVGAVSEDSAAAILETAVVAAFALGTRRQPPRRGLQHRLDLAGRRQRAGRQPGLRAADFRLGLRRPRPGRAGLPAASGRPRAAHRVGPGSGGRRGRLHRPAIRLEGGAARSFTAARR